MIVNFNTILNAFFIPNVFPFIGIKIVYNIITYEKIKYHLSVSEGNRAELS